MTAVRVDDSGSPSVIPRLRWPWGVKLDPSRNAAEQAARTAELARTSAEPRELVGPDDSFRSSMTEAFADLVRDAVAVAVATRVRIVKHALLLTAPDRRDLVYERMGPVARREWTSVCRWEADEMIVSTTSDWSLACRLPEQRRSE